MSSSPSTEFKVVGYFALPHRRLARLSTSQPPAASRRLKAVPARLRGWELRRESSPDAQNAAYERLQSVYPTVKA